jgi:hypothetical protein
VDFGPQVPENKYQITQKWKKQRKKELIQAFGLV